MYVGGVACLEHQDVPLIICFIVREMKLWAAIKRCGQLTEILFLGNKWGWFCCSHLRSFFLSFYRCMLELLLLLQQLLLRLLLIIRSVILYLFQIESVFDLIPTAGDHFKIDGNTKLYFTQFCISLYLILLFAFGNNYSFHILLFETWVFMILSHSFCRLHIDMVCWINAEVKSGR